MNAFDRWYAMTDCDFVSKDAARECWNAALGEAKKIAIAEENNLIILNDLEKLKA